MKDGGRVALTSTGSTSLRFTRISDINSVFSVLRPTDFTSNSNSFILGDTNSYDYHSGNSGWLAAPASAVVRNGANYLNGTSVALALARSAGQYVLSMIHTSNTARANTISQDRNGQYGQRSWIGNRQEIIIYSDDRTNQRTDIEGNISAYYQSAKLLDESYGSGAEAAYSVRQLKRDNTECMVIRRASDSTTTTIGFDGSGNIDEAAITTFCTGTTCTVSSWLDQSGNDNHATTTGTEPIIYTGGAIVRNDGKVGIDFGTAYSALKYTGQDLNLSEITATIVGKETIQSTAQGEALVMQSDNNDGFRTHYQGTSARNRTTGTNVDVNVGSALNFDVASFT